MLFFNRKINLIFNLILFFNLNIFGIFNIEKILKAQPSLIYKAFIERQAKDWLIENFFEKKTHKDLSNLLFDCFKEIHPIIFISFKELIFNNNIYNIINISQNIKKIGKGFLGSAIIFFTKEFLLKKIDINKLLSKSIKNNKNLDLLIKGYVYNFFNFLIDEYLENDVSNDYNKIFNIGFLIFKYNFIKENK